jgi:hypothetical protein
MNQGGMAMIENWTDWRNSLSKMQDLELYLASKALHTLRRHVKLTLHQHRKLDSLWSELCMREKQELYHQADRDAQTEYEMGYPVGCPK